MTGTQLCDACWNVERGLEQFLRSYKAQLYVARLLREACSGESYDPSFGDESICVCGHPYYRHFDTYDDMASVGCKYCECYDFVEKNHV